MATFHKFEEIKAWENARQLTIAVYAVTRQGEFARDFGLRDQIQRAVVSIGSNIAEGFERNGNKEFIKFLYYAKGSAGEVISQLYTAYDVGYISQQDLESMVSHLKTLGASIASFQAVAKRATVRGLMHRKD